MRLSYALIPAAALLLALPASAQIVNNFDYPTMLHTFWKLSPPPSYEPYAAEYSRQLGGTPNARSKHELDDAKAETFSAAQIAEIVEQTDATEPMVIHATEAVGKYDQAAKAFEFTPLNPASYYVSNPPILTSQALPHLKARFYNTTQIKTLPMPEELARELLNSQWDRQVDIDITFVPKEAKTAAKEVRGTITDVRVSFADERFGRTKRQGELAHYTFDPKSGKLLTLEYTGPAK